MRVRLFLRAIIVLAFAGLFVAGALSVGKLLHYELPCGPTHGCDIVNNHPSSRWFGVPVAYFGFGGYLLILGLAILRASMEASLARRVALVGYVVAGFGALTSVALQIYSLTVIHATCLWCLTSAGLMLFLLFFHALEYGDRVSEDVPKGSGEFGLATGMAVLVVALLVGFSMNLKKATYTAEVVTPVKEYPLVPARPHTYGDETSPITIVEFADLMCPHCQTESPLVKEFVGDHPGKIRLVYRNFPLQMHPMATLAAAVGEAAAEEGDDKFWAFATGVMATGQNMESAEEVWAVAQKVGLNVDKLKARLKDANGPAMKRLTQDISTANALGIISTPTFVVQAPGMETKAFSYTALMDALKSGEYAKMIGADAR